MKILFLDIDGVLNNTGSRGLHSDKLGLLRRIIIHTACKVVLSSSWRNNSDLVERITREIKILNFTPKLPEDDRDREIFAWFQTNTIPIKDLKFCILDDTDKFPSYKDYLVQTNGDVGLTPELALKVIEKLS